MFVKFSCVHTLIRLSKKNFSFKIFLLKPTLEKFLDPRLDSPTNYWKYAIKGSTIYTWYCDGERLPSSSLWVKYLGTDRL